MRPPGVVDLGFGVVYSLNNHLKSPFECRPHPETIVGSAFGTRRATPFGRKIGWRRARPSFELAVAALPYLRQFVTSRCSEVLSDFVCRKYRALGVDTMRQ